MLLAELFLLVLAFVLVGCVSASEYIRLQREIDRLRYALEYMCHRGNADDSREPAEPPPSLLPLKGHTIIVGRSGSGKSNIAMLELHNRLKAGQLLYLVDVKQELCPIFGAHCEQCVDTDEAEKVFDYLLDVAKKRREMFRQATAQYKRPCRDLDEFKKVTGVTLPVCTLVLEELIVLTRIVDPTKLKTLLVTGRSAGVFVFALSQYLKATILDRDASINFNTRVFLGKWDLISAGILLGNMTKQEIADYSAHVGSPGAAVVDLDGKGVELVQFPRVDEDYLQEWIQ